MLIALIVTLWCGLLYFRLTTESSSRQDTLDGWLFGIGLVGGFAIALMPFIGHQEEVKRITLDPDSVRVAYNPETDETSFAFEDSDGNFMTMDTGIDSGSFRAGPEAELVKTCPEPYPMVSFYSYPICEWTLFAPSK